MARYDNLVRWVKKVFWLWSDNNTTSTPQSTTPTTTQPNIQTETLSWGQSSFSANPKTNVQRNIESNLDKWFLSKDEIETIWTRTTWWDNTLSELWGSLKSIPSAIWGIIQNNNEKKRYILWTNESSRYKLVPVELWVKWWDDNLLFNNALNQYANDWDMDRFYDTVKNSFEARKMDDIVWLERHREIWSFAIDKWKIALWDYNISKQELSDYVDMISENDWIQRKSWTSTWEWEDDSNSLISLSNSSKEKHNYNFLQWAESWILDYANKKLNSKAKNRIVPAMHSAIQEQVTRVSEHTLPVYSLEQLVLAKDKSSWTDADKDVIKVANALREIETLYAWNLNRWAKETIQYWTDNDWEIRSSLIKFTNNDTLGSLLTWNLKDAAKKLDYEFNDWDSAIDIVSKLAEDVTYKYQQENTDSKLRKKWNRLMHVWDEWERNMWELWQDIFWWLWQLWWWKTITEYMDQDFTAAWIFDSTASSTKQVFNKYWAQFLEYMPEVVWGLIPEAVEFVVSIGLWASAWWAAWWGVWTAPWAVVWGAVWAWAFILSKAEKIKKVAKLVKTIVSNKVINTIKEVPVVWKTVNTIAKYVEESPKIDKWLKLLTEVATKWGKEALYWMTIDARLNPYDTERYSDLSYYSSIIWSAVTDIAPKIRTSWKWLLDYNKIIDWLWKVSISDAIDWIDIDNKVTSLLLSELTWRRITWEEAWQAVKAFVWVEWAMSKVYNELTDDWKKTFDTFIKNQIWNSILAKEWADSTAFKNIQSLINSPYANVADIVKYAYKLPTDISIWPYISKITLKNWTDANVIWKQWLDWKQKQQILSIEWWIVWKIERWFTDNDIAKLGKLWDWTFKDMVDDKTWKYFTQVWDRKYLTREWYEKLWLELSNESVASLGLELSRVEDVKELLKTRMKWLKWRNISDETIDAIAETWAYDEIVSKISEVIC